MADTRNLEDVLASGKDRIDWILSFIIVITHNMESSLLGKLSNLLWQTAGAPSLVVVKTAGFLAEFSLQFHEHPIIESHNETAPSLRIDNAFPELKEHALSLDLENMDSTDHAHVPYVVLLIRALEDWKQSHNGAIPKTYPEKKGFKAKLLSSKHKFDEENLDEAEGQAYRTWTPSTVPSEIKSLFTLAQVTSLTVPSEPFFLLLRALKKFVDASGGFLPLTSSLPDMKASTTTYIHLQKLYKTRAEKEKAELVSYLETPVPQDIVDSFLKNCHGIVFLEGRRYGELDEDRIALSNILASSISSPHQHLPLLPEGSPPLEDQEEWTNAVGELIRSPTADPPNTAVFMGGLVAQEVIKFITKKLCSYSSCPAIKSDGKQGKDWRCLCY
ncbi:hypothetical protein DL96DRAFT_1819219 [Flagelloscypha sp. PMI_526]|nr:hypothetical protein DL96DRAFT_1819219 [Flagelloscypha sp. PMI_526]